MSALVPNLELEVVWFDDHMIELSLAARSVRFSGRTTFYAAHDEPAMLATQIEGFPNGPNDVREYEFGGLELPGYGGAKLRLSCVDAIGHVRVQVTVGETALVQNGRSVESATIQLGAVPAAIDSFVEQLRGMRVRVGDTAVLNS